MSTDLSDLMAEDSQSPLNLPSNEGLGGVQKLANDILAAQTRVENLESDLKAAKQTLLKLTDEDLPSQMTEIGLTNFTLADGSKVDIKETYGARIKKDNEQKAFRLLRRMERATSSKTPSRCASVRRRTTKQKPWLTN